MAYQSLVSFEYWTLIAQICNLFIQIYLIKRFLFKPIKAILKKRQDEVDSIYGDANRAKTDAETAKNEYETKLFSAHKEAEQITSAAVTSAQNRSDSIIIAAENDAKAIREKASADIEMERRKALDDAKNQISDIAVEIAEKIVSKEIDADNHKALIDQFINDLGDEL